MTKHRSHRVAFKRQVAQEFIGGETLHGLSKRHDISRQLSCIWVGKDEAGALDDDAQAADLLQEYEAKITALVRMVGRQALQIEFPKGALKSELRPRNGTTTVIVNRPSPTVRPAGPAGQLAKDPPPGNMVMGRGLARLTDIALGAEIMGH